jgi:exopolysaccharide biosynthesis protein
VLSTNSDSSRAQRTFIGTNGDPGDLWVVVSDGRYNDGESAGLTYRQTGEYLISKGCTFGLCLDGGGSSTMYFDGEVLNASKDNERAVVDFVYYIG